ncbi:hypothetical protein Y032_0007g3285 [Ancylostoma ceylanicum]|nr:hypothetical protein Y032_0007g3285 [Ancylostoma ceylanicum]
MWKSIAERMYFTALRVCDIFFGTNLFAPAAISFYARGRVAHLPNAFLDGFSDLPSVAMEQIFSNVCGEDMSSLQMVCKRWRNLIKSHPSRYANSSITDVTISFNNGLRYIAQSTDGQQGQCLRAQQIRRNHRDLASLVPRLAANRLELRIHNIECRYSDLHLSSVKTQAVDIKFCRQICDALKSHVEAFLSELALNPFVKSVSISSEVAQRGTTLPKNIFKLFESNNIQLNVSI